MNSIHSIVYVCVLVALSFVSSASGTSYSPATGHFTCEKAGETCSLICDNCGNIITEGMDQSTSEGSTVYSSTGEGINSFVTVVGDDASIMECSSGCKCDIVVHDGCFEVPPSTPPPTTVSVVGSAETSLPPASPMSSPPSPTPEFAPRMVGSGSSMKAFSYVPLLAASVLFFLLCH